MTTPEVEIEDILPYSIQYEARADEQYHMPIEGQRQKTYRHFLEPGVYQIQLSFTGTESVYLWWRPTGYYGATHYICKIPASESGEPRNSALVTVQAGPGAYFAVVSNPRPNTQENPTSTASVLIFPLPS